MILEKLLEQIFLFFFHVTNSYGISLVLLSLSVTVIMFPLYLFAELLQRKEHDRKSSMQYDLDEIKDLKSKQEKYYYTKEIYRKYNYKSYFALTGLIGLAIQVPFFIAAYWMLLEYTPLEGVSFGPINNLFQPDQIISIGGLTLNVLPILMTLVNLLGIGFQYKYMNKNEAKQLIFIAFVFLVLLYNLPAALVLYWTMNNVFAIGKNRLLKKMPNKLLYSNGLVLKVMGYLKFIYSFVKKNDYIIYVVLFGLFPLLSFFYSNIGELYFSSISLMLVVIFLSHIILSLIAKIIFMDKSKVMVFGFFVVIAVFSFGHIIDYFGTQFIYIKLRYFYLIYFIMFVLVSLFIFKTKTNLKKVSKSLKFLSVFLFIIILSQITIYKILNPNKTEYLEANRSTEKIGENVTSIEQHPDIYYVVLDGYANSKILLDYFGFDNSVFENFLKNKGFYLAEDSRTNYVSTFLNMASTLNMRHINYLKNELGVVTKDRRIPNQMSQNNEVVKYLKDKGYITIRFKNPWYNDKGYQYDFNYGRMNILDEATSNFIQTTIFKVIADRMSVNYANNILYTFDRLPKFDDKKNSAPKFVYAHIVCPHPPYVFNKNGGINMEYFKLDNNWTADDKKHYLEQLQFMNTKTVALINELLEMPTETVIVLQSDHGPAFLGNERGWNNPNIELIRERSLILNAILLNTKDQKYLYPEVSSVNTFRVVFNNVFNDSLEILHDSTYWSIYETPYNFENVTDVINK